jgi:hypothetical protein
MAEDRLRILAQMDELAVRWRLSLEEKRAPSIK